MENHWISGVNDHEGYGRLAFTEVYQIETDFEAKVESERMIDASLESGAVFTLK